MRKSIKIMVVLALVTLLFVSSISIALADPPPWSRHLGGGLEDVGGVTMVGIHAAQAGENEDWICALGNLKMDGDVVDSDFASDTNSKFTVCETSADNPSGTQAWINLIVGIFNTSGYDAEQLEDQVGPWYK